MGVSCAAVSGGGCQALWLFPKDRELVINDFSSSRFYCFKSRGTPAQSLISSVKLPHALFATERTPKFSQFLCIEFLVSRLAGITPCKWDYPGLEPPESSLYPNICCLNPLFRKSSICNPFISGVCSLS